MSRVGFGKGIEQMKRMPCLLRVRAPAGRAPGRPALPCPSRRTTSWRGHTAQRGRQRRERPPQPRDALGLAGRAPAGTSRSSRPRPRRRPMPRRRGRASGAAARGDGVCCASRVGHSLPPGRAQGLLAEAGAGAARSSIAPRTSADIFVSSCRPLERSWSDLLQNRTLRFCRRYRRASRR